MALKLIDADPDHASPCGRIRRTSAIYQFPGLFLADANDFLPSSALAVCRATSSTHSDISFPAIIPLHGDCARRDRLSQCDARNRVSATD